MVLISDETHMMELCSIVAKRSTCKRSRCGSIVIDIKNHMCIGIGHNSMPCDIDAPCFKDDIPSNFKSDRNCCVHAEQRSIMDALKRHPDKIKGSRLYFVRIDDDGNIKMSGKPYCTICSKMALDVGIAEFVLWHQEGITIYNTEEYNNLSFQYRECSS